ncbi:hypothetical protein C8Q76DRAFT_418486 [Earliella scabrosa]|nr:hypothetical protein C8Q76DRAFT_418486 [Earliella scabrosa]
MSGEDSNVVRLGRLPAEAELAWVKKAKEERRARLAGGYCLELQEVDIRLRTGIQVYTRIQHTLSMRKDWCRNRRRNVSKAKQQSYLD